MEQVDLRVMRIPETDSRGVTRYVDWVPAQPYFRLRKQMDDIHLMLGKGQFVDACNYLSGILRATDSANVSPSKEG